MKLGDFIQTADFKSEKHAPVIEILSEIKENQPLDVLLSVGKEIGHPNTDEHYIGWMALYFKPEGEKFVRFLGKTEFSSHGAFATEPKATFTVKLPKPGTLIAESYCNLHGLWESNQQVTF
ncbi:MAG: class II SORL domain-containing protein [Planctomycetes bacterium]|jgi:superoxide reductase|nr:class II SORL domain-containing protein [Planctomycetota bacterium]HPY74131.1 class II SORL domain-containing protein [Planctomycetota bacterium]HQA99677.1 class II SORL domain-containing protein [Planctomycetota bacterium]